jgi:hypothetical protein
MLSATDQLNQIASEIATDIRQRAKPEPAQIEARNPLMGLQFDTANPFRKRLSNFRHEIGGEFQCPRCWLLNGTKTPLIALASCTKDFFACKVCGLTVRIEAEP